MKQRYLLGACALFYIGSWCPPGACAQAEELYVQVGATKLREQPKIWAKSISDLRYGDRLTGLKNASGWAEVQTRAGQKGFVSLSAVTPKKVLFSSRGSAAQVESDDVVLAGKGFSREVEESTRASDRSLNYRAVEAMERLEVSPEELRTFINAGKLNS